MPQQIPEGYRQVTCEGINATVPMPEDWFYNQEAGIGNVAYFMTRENFQPGNSQSHFETGLQISAVRNARSKFDGPAVLFAKSFVEEPKPRMVPTSEVVAVRNGPLFTFRRTVHFPGGMVEGRMGLPLSLYLAATGNNKQDIAYLVTFETPTPLWEQYQAVGHTMITGIVFDPNVS